MVCSIGAFWHLFSVNLLLKADNIRQLLKTSFSQGVRIHVPKTIGPRAIK